MATIASLEKKIVTLTNIVTKLAAANGVDINPANQINDRWVRSGVIYKECNLTREQVRYKRNMLVVPGTTTIASEYSNVLQFTEATGHYLYNLRMWKTWDNWYHL